MARGERGERGRESRIQRKKGDVKRSGLMASQRPPGPARALGGIDAISGETERNRQTNQAGEANQGETGRRRETKGRD